MRPKKTGEAIALQPILGELRIPQRITVDESMALLRELHEATEGSLWPGLSGNAVCAFANLVLARHGGDHHRRTMGHNVEISGGTSAALES